MKITGTSDSCAEKAMEMQKSSPDEVEEKTDDTLSEECNPDIALDSPCLSDSDFSEQNDSTAASNHYDSTDIPLETDSGSTFLETDGWDSCPEYLLSSCGFVVGIGSILRFTSLASQNGGGSFCVAYITLMFTCGIPLVYLETCIGQYVRGGPVVAWRILPLSRGLSLAMVTVSALLSIYYSMVVAWSLYYLIASMGHPLPWLCYPQLSVNGVVCENVANFSSSMREYLVSRSKSLEPLHLNGTNVSMNLYQLPGGQYFQSTVLDLSKGIGHLGELQWALVLCMLLTWLFVFLALIKGIYSLGKLMYLTAVIPYFLLLALLICVCMMDGAVTGIKYFLAPRWKELECFKIWVDAANQLFFSLGLGTGCLTMMAGYTHFHSNCFRNAFLTSSMNMFGTGLAGIVMFAVYGIFTRKLGISLNSLNLQALDIGFISFPEITSEMTVAPLWAIFFYLLLTMVGIDSTVILVQNIVSSLQVVLPKHLQHKRLLLVLIICLLLFLIGLPLTSQAGLYIAEMMDACVPSWSLLVICLLECIVLMWLYGAQKFIRHVSDMTGSLDSLCWKWTWKVLTPAAILIVIGFTVVIHIFVPHWDKHEEQVSQSLGWILSMVPVALIPSHIAVAILTNLLTDRCTSVKKHLENLLKTPPEWGPKSHDEEEPMNEIPDYVICSSDSHRPANALALLTANLYLPNIGTMVNLEERRVSDPGGYLADLVTIASTDSDSTEEENKVRGNWSRRVDFMLACLGYVVGLGNVWRFPYLVYRNGGGAFFIPYLIMLIFCGIPLVYMELAHGQYGSLGPITVWKAVPLFKGIGYGMVLVSGMIGVYYTMVTAWAFHYLFSSMTSVLPWQHCDHKWNTKYCTINKYNMANLTEASFNNRTMNLDRGQLENFSLLNSTGSSEQFRSLSPNAEKILEQSTGAKYSSPSEEYFYLWVLNSTNSINDLGEIRWQMALCLLLCWVIVFLCVVKGIKTSGKVVYLIVTFPYLIILVLLVRGLTVEGHLEGIKFYLTPKWERLMDVHVWSDAAAQVFFSLSVCWGGLTTLSSYNKFHNNIFRDTIFVCIGDTVMSLLSGFSVFAVIGVLGKELNTTVEHVIASDVSLAFIAYPAAISYLPAAPLWAILFFVMLVMMGLSTEITVVETIVTAIIDERIELFRKKRIAILTIVCATLYLLGLPMTTNGGIHVLQLMDECTGLPVMIIGIFMCIAISWVYGVKKFSHDIKQMIGHSVSLWWRFLWCVVSPVILVFVVVFYIVDFKPLLIRLQKHKYPPWADDVAFVVMSIPVTTIPIWMAIKLMYAEGSALQRIKQSCQSEIGWGPALERHWEHVEYIPSVYTYSGSFPGLAVQQLPIASISDHVEFSTSGIRMPSLSETSLLSLSPKGARAKKQLDMRQRAILNHAYSNPQCNSSTTNSTEKLAIKTILYDSQDNDIIIVPRPRFKVDTCNVATQTDPQDLENQDSSEDDEACCDCQQSTDEEKSTDCSQDGNDEPAVLEVEVEVVQVTRL